MGAIWMMPRVLALGHSPGMHGSKSHHQSGTIRVHGRIRDFVPTLERASLGAAVLRADAHLDRCSSLVLA